MANETGGDAMIFDTSEQTFADDVIAASARTPMLVDFWADWCMPCHQLAPSLFAAVKGREGSVRLAKVLADDNMKLAGHYRVRGFPTVILFVDGEERGRFSGARRRPWIDNFLDTHISGAAEPGGEPR